jgi:hypothetical protein
MCTRGGSVLGGRVTATWGWCHIWTLTWRFSFTGLTAFEAQCLCIEQTVGVRCVLLSLADRNIILECCVKEALILSRFRGDYRQGLDWWMDLLTNNTYDSKVQVIIPPSIISTIQKSPQHPLSFVPAWCVSTSSSLATAFTVEIPQLRPLKSSLDGLPYKAD